MIRSSYQNHPHRVERDLIALWKNDKNDRLVAEKRPRNGKITDRHTHIYKPWQSATVQMIPSSPSHYKVIFVQHFVFYSYLNFGTRHHKLQWFACDHLLASITGSREDPLTVPYSCKHHRLRTVGERDQLLIWHSPVVCIPSTSPAINVDQVLYSQIRNEVISAPVGRGMDRWTGCCECAVLRECNRKESLGFQRFFDR